MSKVNILLMALLIALPVSAQTKKIKRPKGTVGISSVDSFVRESFDLYDKVYMYDGYAAAGKSLEDEDIDILEEALSDVTALSESAPDIISDLDGVGALKQAKALLRINRAKKALKYAIKTAKELLLGRPTQETKEEEDPKQEADPENQSGTTETSSDTNQNTNNTGNSEGNIPSVFKINSKFDFVPGNKILFFDDFSNDFIGDFPAKWNTNSGGEVVTINENPKRWFHLQSGSSTIYIPNMGELPEEYTIEFDVITNGITKRTSGSSGLQVHLEESDKLRQGGKNTASLRIPLMVYSAGDILVKGNPEGGDNIYNSITADIRQIMRNNPHFMIAVNKQRLRFWINETKYVDVPKLVAPNGVIKTLKFNLYGLDPDDGEQLFITNIKVAEGGLDLRRTLMSTGKVSTNGILFDTGSSNIQPQSYGILRQISQVLQQDKTMKLNIIGHTDSDGTDAANMGLSKDRAAAVKHALVTTYGMSSDRISTDGKGAGEPVADNTTPDGKAQNRRVEFIKM
jgi:outer membrane protein OmpA-like peptidoglycan-associated protein